ncbi:hypothetical protein CBM2586_A100186 [Cupriavidus phytorum]|uniref:Uncharacterized protein n=1 Tax=Cupriavidus taiwanensis TaxID=164546 RepID=A0A976A3V0_9BURK|nr:hypothetical protein CBM2586_A100186 [Cupriavidus taiwanensis]
MSREAHGPRRRVSNQTGRLAIAPAARHRRPHLSTRPAMAPQSVPAGKLPRLKICYFVGGVYGKRYRQMVQ